MIHEGNFHTGDRVTWRNDHYAELTDGRERWGDGPFIVKSTRRIEGAQNIRGAGHCQHVFVQMGGAIKQAPDECFSGAFFQRVSE